MNTREVNVAVEGLDTRAIAGSFTVHLAKDGRRIASRFFFQAADSAGLPQSGPPLAHFDFLLPIDVVADGKLSIEVEPAGSTLPGEPPQLDQMGHPTLSVYLMLEFD